jgi:hypothetical protein
MYGAPGGIVADPFGVPVNVDAPDGVYYVNIGLYREVGQQAVSLPLVQNGRTLEATSLNIGPIKVGDASFGLTAGATTPQTTLNQPFGEEPGLTLLGYDLAVEPEPPPAGAPTTLQIPSAGQDTALRLNLMWLAETRLPADYTTFVHVRNVSGEIVAQKDQPPLGGTYPTSLWDPGEIIADEILVPLPAELPAGEYRLVIGMYEFETGARLPVPGREDNSVLLEKVEILP